MAGKICIPSKTVTVRPQDLPWMNNNLRKLMRKRNRLFEKYKKDKSVETYNKFKKIRNEVTSLLRKSEKYYINSLATKLKSSDLEQRLLENIKVLHNTNTDFFNYSAPI